MQTLSANLLNFLNSSAKIIYCAGNKWDTNKWKKELSWKRQFNSAEKAKEQKDYLDKSKAFSRSQRSHSKT